MKIQRTATYYLIAVFFIFFVRNITDNAKLFLKIPSKANLLNGRRIPIISLANLIFRYARR
ncbi:hypothetical protein DBR39_12280 [Chryseobacterium sp. KBW03]|nr:hypothetical protein DBR39_12280 [Chryseobacterium sp. KBW03]